MTTSLRRTQGVGALVLTTTLVLLGCGDDGPGDAGGTTSTGAAPVIDPGDGGRYDPDLDPTAFVDGIDNPYLPLRAGARWVYEDEEAGERIEVVVTDRHKTVMGIDAVVVQDTVSEDGTVVEDTEDWFAQDADGTVWYLGEASEEYEDGEVSTAGSWESGVDGALPGILMQASPRVGVAYRQEFYRGEAEDMAEIVRVGASVTVAAGSFDDVVVIREWNPLEPEVVEEKYYARGVGVVLEVVTQGGSGRVELIEFTPGA